MTNLPDPVISGFFKKYGATRARADGSPSDEFVLRQIALYRATLMNTEPPGMRDALANLLLEAGRRGLTVT